MKITKNTYLTIGFLALLSTASCDFIFVDKSEKGQQANVVETAKIEADLLLIAAEKNLSCISWCETIEKATLDEDLKTAAQTIKQSQLEIAKHLQTTAQEHMVLVANKLPLNVPRSKQIEELENYQVQSFKKLRDNLKFQRHVMDSLLRQSDDTTIRGMAQASIIEIKSNIEITQHTLERLGYH